MSLKELENFNPEQSYSDEINVRLKTPKKKQASYMQKRWIFGRAAGFEKRGYRVVNEVPQFYYITDNIMVCPPLDGLLSTKSY